VSLAVRMWCSCWPSRCDLAQLGNGIKFEQRVARALKGSCEGGSGGSCRRLVRAVTVLGGRKLDPSVATVLQCARPDDVLTVLRAAYRSSISPARVCTFGGRNGMAQPRCCCATWCLVEDLGAVRWAMKLCQERLADGDGRRRISRVLLSVRPQPAIENWALSVRRRFGEEGLRAGGEGVGKGSGMTISRRSSSRERGRAGESSTSTV